MLIFFFLSGFLLVSSKPAQSKLKFPWSDNLVELPIANATILSEFIQGNSTEIPAGLEPFINKTAFFEWKKGNETEDWIIRDEDVAEEDLPELNKAIYDGEKTTINLSPEAGEQLFQHWIDQAVSGLMAAVATTRLEKMGNDTKKEHQDCAKKSKTVAAHAKCVVNLIDMKVPQSPKKKSAPKKFKRILKKGIYKKRWWNKRKMMKLYKKRKNGMGSFLRVKRELPFPRWKVKQMSHYRMKSQKKSSLLGDIAKKMTKMVRAFKNKDTEDLSWQQTMDDIMVEAKKLQKIEKVKKMLQKRMDSFSDVARDLGIQSNPGLKAFDFVMDDDPLVKSKEDQLAEARKKEKNLTLDEQIMRAPIQLVREGVKLGMALSGQDVSHFDNKTLKMISPRVMSLMPEEDDKDTMSLLSPSLLSFYNKTSPEEHFSFPSITKIFDENGHEEMLNLVFEASGVSDAVGYMKVLRGQQEREGFMERLRSDAGSKTAPTLTNEEVKKFVGTEEREKMERLEKLHHMFTEEQIGKLNKTGYFGMTPEQLEFIYGKNSPYNDSQALKMYSNMTEERQQYAVENTIRKLASEEMAFKIKRQKDVVLTLVVYLALIGDPAFASQPIILSPVILSTLILSPAIFGVVVLSPWLFVPLILSPRILGPIILNPFAFVPVILTPLALNPVVLCPGVGLPIILSPLVLNPFILTPLALTPVILSPFALSPFIADPNVLTPIILSPFVLSPLIWSPPAVSAFILTPYALSPVIQSDGAVFTAVLSPSWLS